MSKVSKKTEYGLLFIINLQGSSYKNPISIRKISDQLGLPYRFLFQIATQLKKKKIINSKEGKGGGYYLNKDLEKINVFDILNILNKGFDLVPCAHGANCKHKDTCGMYPGWQKMQKEIDSIFKNYSLKDLISG